MEKPLGQLLESLPSDQRVARYREFAKEALRQAALITDPTVRSNCLMVAAGWHALASESERLMDSYGIMGPEIKVQDPSNQPTKN